MPDDADLANDHMEKELAAIQAAHRVSRVPATGFCLYCDEPLAPGRRWCDVECRDGYEAEQRQLGLAHRSEE